MTPFFFIFCVAYEGKLSIVLFDALSFNHEIQCGFVVQHINQIMDIDVHVHQLICNNALNQIEVWHVRNNVLYWSGIDIVTRVEVVRVDYLRCITFHLHLKLALNVLGNIFLLFFWYSLVFLLVDVN